MPDIKESVGEGGTNRVHDVALVQAMLTVIKNAKNKAYLNDYDGKPGPATKGAIIQFQTDQGLLKPAAKPASGGAAPTAPAPPAAAGEKEGLIDKGSATLAKMVAALPSDYKDMLIIENTRTVYFPGAEADCTASAAAIILVDLEPIFRGRVAQLVKLMYDTHKIVLWLTGSGGRRTFDQQMKQTGTKAGPGESNHNFGRAVDIGFNNFQWLAAGGAKVNDDWWLNKMTKNNADKVGKAKANELWAARDAIATKPPLGLFNSILDGDDDHLQSFDDHLRNDLALAALLNLVGAMKWEAVGGTPRRYNCDLGLGGKLFNVGTAKEIWSLNATVTKAMIAQARTDALMKAALAKGPAAAKAVVRVKEADITADDLTKMKKSLKDDFFAAEKDWLKWKAVP